MQPGDIYIHYKSKTKRYEIVGEAMHSETQEPLVVYKALYDSAEYPKGTLWARPKKLFFQDVVHADGQTVPRFRKQNE